MENILVVHQTRRHSLYYSFIVLILLTATFLSILDTLYIQLLILTSLILLIPQIKILQFSCCLRIQSIQFQQLYDELNKMNLTCIIFGFLIYFALNLDNAIGFKLFLINQVVFHMGELLHVCFYKFEILKWQSFLINHSFAYNVAIAIAILEYWLEYLLFDKNIYFFIVLGIIATLIGHAFRIGAFIEAKQSFHHIVQKNKAPDHVLVTSGIYSISRHPSYFGFWIYSLGQQLILCNLISFICYIPVLYRFFIDRISYEEYYLIKFFGQDYIDYQQKTSTQIPFIDQFIQHYI